MPATTNFTSCRKSPAFWAMLGLSLAYLVYLGWCWLPLGYSAQELSAGVSRIWDIKRELAAGRLPWWTPNFMSGSSYGLNYAQGFYLIPWLLYSLVVTPAVAGKLMALTAMLASAVAMFFCARHFLKNDWAATLSALAYLLHQQQLDRAAGAEHVGLVVVFPFFPLLFWLFARALESGKFRDAFWCALAMCGLMWTSNKQGLIFGIFLAGYLIFWIMARKPAARQAAVQSGLRSVGVMAVMSLLLGAFFIVPGLVESKHVKLFAGAPMEAWQRTYAFKSVLGIADRDQALVRATKAGVLAQLQQNGGKVRSEAEANAIRRLFSMEMDGKYTGLSLLGLLAVTMLFNQRRVNRGLFWLLVGFFLLCVMLATGLTNVWLANLETWQALFAAPGVPGSVTTGVVIGGLVLAGMLVLFARRKLTTGRKWGIAAAVLAVFLIVPGFKLLALLPLFKDIRNPFVFYDIPVAFLISFLAGFFVTDVWGERKQITAVVAGLGILMLLDFWPAQLPAKDNRMPARTLQNLAATYSALAKDPDWVKTSSISGRYFHLLGPMYGGKPQMYEAWVNWMAPWGSGLLNSHAWESLEALRASLNLLGTRYIVFDKTDESNAGGQMLGALRQLFPVQLENEDFVVFRNAAAHPYVSATAGKCLFVGDGRESAPLALALTSRNYTLIQATETDERRIPASELSQYAKVYSRTSSSYAPAEPGTVLALTDVELRRASAAQVQIRLTAPTNCVAVVAESYYPFWQAKVDGKTAPVLRADCGLMGIEVPAGRHAIDLRYEIPRAYAIAGWISLLTLVGGVAGSCRRPRTGV